MSSPNFGGWTEFSFTLTPMAKSVLESVLPLGAKYTPIAFATQVVAGTNYCFLCEAQYATPVSSENVVLVYVYQPANGKPVLHKIVSISP